MPRPFRFGLTIGDHQDRSSLIEVARRAEDVGFDVLAGVDHIGPPLGVLPMLATICEITNLRVSSMVIANDYRHPVMLAKDAATIDVLSEGRFELGIGSGWIKAQYESAGIRYDRGGIRLRRLEEAIAVIKGCWTGEPFTFTGDHYEVDLIGSPVPVQRPHPPILLGGAGRKMLQLGGREADIVGITLTAGLEGFDAFSIAMATSGDRVADQLSWVREGAGDRFSEIELSVMAHHLMATEAVGETARDIATESGATTEQVLDSPHILLGSSRRIADTLIERRERFGFSYVVFRGAQFNAAAAIVERLAGT